MNKPISVPKLAKNIKIYLDKGIPFEKIQETAEAQGIDPEIWARAIELYERNADKEGLDWLKHFAPMRLLLYVGVIAGLWFGFLKPQNEELDANGYYINRKEKIEFQVPDGWYKDTTKEKSTFGNSKILFVNSDQAAMGVDASTYFSGLSIEENLATWEKGFTKMGADADPQEEIMVASEKATLSSIRLGHMLNMKMILLNCMVRTEDLQYTFLLVVEDSSLETAKKDFQEMLKSVKFR